MKRLRITIVLPFPATRPGGGIKIMYEYANRLQQRGHQVTVVHSIRRPYKKMKSPLWWKQWTYRIKRADRPSWFPLLPQIKSVIIPEVTDAFVPDGDIVLSTWWEMAYMTAQLSTTKGKAFNLIQDYEIWAGNVEAVHQSYSLPIQHLVIARYLQVLVEEYSGKKPIHIPNAIDTSTFKITEPSATRPAETVMMLYSKEPRKGTSFGLEGLQALKQEVPQLSVTLFGVFDKPVLPSWITYHKKPPNLAALYNQHAVFLTPSLGEGWALPPAEAMACGCAVVCTNIGGHADYAIDKQTALLIAPKNPTDIRNKVGELIKNEQLRLQLAANGNRFIQEAFSWNSSLDQLEAAFYSK